MNAILRSLQPLNQLLQLLQKDHVTLKTDVMMLKIQLCITGINNILKYIKIENNYFKL